MSILSKKQGRPVPAAVLAAALLAGGCTLGPPRPTPYQAAEDGYGFRQEAASPGAYQVTFRGNAGTARQEVEGHLLRRMAELALEEGSERFTIVEQGTDCITTLRVSPTTTCTYRQSGDAMFPYFLTEFDETTFGRPIARREYEATAFMRLGGASPCLEAEQCYEARAVAARLGADDGL